MERPPGVPESFDVRTVVYLRSGANLAFPERDAPVGELVRLEDL